MTACRPRADACFPLLGLRAVVTGASRGIGRQTAITLAARGADVAVVDLALETGSELDDDDRGPTAREIGRLGRHALAIQADLAVEDEARHAVASAVAEWGGVDILVNVAGGAITPYESSAPSRISTDEVRTCLDVNLMSAIHMCQAAIPAMMESARARRAPSIVNTTSLASAGVLPRGMLSGYALAKAALGHYTRSLAEELGPAGVRVNAVSPGYVMTDRVRANSTSTGFAGKSEHSALRRLGTPEDIATCIAFLASSDAAYVTGQELSVDGATRLQ